MSRSTRYTVTVQFGDCDPAGIVFFPNFLRWMDASSLHFFRTCGLPPWRELERTRGIVGTPVLEIQTRFSSPATYGDTIDVHTRIESWRNKVFVHSHRVMLGERLLCEGTETRAFVERGTDGRIHAIPVPEDIRALCS
ncbi:4-hydroxybenzoyl-CoA thioesterase [Pigmentiphaga sp. NML080357]|uniref:acyl-CoA thioesterase n=1 Tax=Pigmentiphaga sp. NML080357 TaxID=2008675 RepID=UPI000B41FF69|nr:thioesterase family protein [Pigmentiphaga sp. NML080357]OVZ59941.1 4-hydroxybenzoyl-CoA thioesterase [Pigmentiphaga sp. NML080357]